MEMNKMNVVLNKSENQDSVVNERLEKESVVPTQRGDSKNVVICTMETSMSEPPPKRHRLSSLSQNKCLSACAVNMSLHDEDNYEHVTPGLVYATTSFPGAGFPSDLFDDIQGCKCDGLCADSCQCFMVNNCPYEDGLLRECHHNKPIFECNERCNCGDRCPSRIVQQGPVKGLKVLSLPNKGYGVISSNFIPRNSFVCEYAGEYIGVEETRARFSKQHHEGNSNYILVLKEFTGDCISTPQITVIDPTVVGNIGRYINHSCEPNLVVIPVRINSMVPVAALFALRDIYPEEELCYDYSNTVASEERRNIQGANSELGGSSGCQIDKRAICEKVTSEKVFNTVSGSCSRDLIDHHELEKEIVHFKSKTNVLGLGTNHGAEGCERLDGQTCGEAVDDVLPMSLPVKLCHCESKNCRKYLPADRDIF